MDYKVEYASWCKQDLEDKDLEKELLEIKDDEKKIEDAFYKELSFGTGGLRGIIGAGCGRMNIYTVAKASQGLADYVIKHFAAPDRSIAISYDSRIKSDLFAKVSAGVFAANGIHAYIYPELMPTPCLSFAVRDLHTAAGIMVTASHNPAAYNGYKVYGADGCQITQEAAGEIQAAIGEVDIWQGVKRISFEEGLSKGLISYIPDEVYDRFTEEVKKLSLLSAVADDDPDISKVDKNIPIVYTPLNGTGLKPVLRALKELGYENITLVEEQAKPDGNFPTCPYPNPEIKEAMARGMETARKTGAELLLATDPDCDRVGIAVRDGDDYRLLSGNETGCLLLDYVCELRKKKGSMPASPVMVKTIVTSELGESIADSYGVKTINVLTGFKYIGEQIELLAEAGRASDYIFGFEESYGYLTGDHVRDKDAVNGALMICDMFAYYKAQGISLTEKLDEIHRRFGYCLDRLYSYEFKGATGEKVMKDIMAAFRNISEDFMGYKVSRVNDYLKGVDGLPLSDVLKFYLEGGMSVVVRPSGTEPKLKIYLSVKGNDEADAEAKEHKLADVIDGLISKFNN
ncbi:phospho-sugar mutase [Butyrivibrio sp. MC2013]|uniref:phospho-sugar mutase n=1 Tax=Butyrivibrio sp. MC2013 TaxID=1280686 RepID=UPI0003FFBC2C|nr:phospho-sugar mutase [Butyrivibrio sp. MC2013]